MRAALRPAVLISICAVAVGGAGQADAQETSTPAQVSAPTLPTKVEPCKLVDGPPDGAGKAQVAVGCGRFGVLLGSGEGAQGQTDPGSGAIAVKLVRFGRTRVFLVTPRIGARPLLEDITGDLAFALGQRVDLGIGDAKVDLSRFAVNREIRVTAGQTFAGKARTSASVALDAHVARASKAAAAPVPAATPPGPAGN